MQLFVNDDRALPNISNQRAISRITEAHQQFSFHSQINMAHLLAFTDGIDFYALIFSRKNLKILSKHCKKED